MTLPKDREIQIIGGGLVGSLWAVMLARMGFQSTVFERRADPRKALKSEGRSINLAVSVRGFHALEEAELLEQVRPIALPMRGRRMHAVDGGLSFQPYGLEDQAIYSVSRAALNCALLEAAERDYGVSIRFEQKLESADFERRELRFERGGRVSLGRVFGTDGASSVLRQAMGVATHSEKLNYGYRELSIPPDARGAFRMDPEALHIWPRGAYMLIALPNHDRSFTCTLFLPFEGEKSFASLTTLAQARAFFEREFSDALAMMPLFEHEWTENPVGQMVTVKTHAWNHGGDALLLGDAAHAIVPFFGQGMNCGFEDCSLLGERMRSGVSSWETLFTEFSSTRRPDADAIADLALENFIEMRDRVSDPEFLKEREIERILQKEFPRDYVSRYALVSFSRVPYRMAKKAGEIQAGILQELGRGIARAADVDLARAKQRIDQELKGLY